LKLSPASTVEPSQIRVVADLADKYPGTLRLFVGEDTLPTPQFIKDAAHQAIDADRTYYTPNAGYPDARAAVAARIEKLHGVEIDPTRQVILTCSGMAAIVLACQATVSQGDSALILTPLWPNLAAAIRVAGARSIEVPLTCEPRGFHLDFDRLESAVRPDTRLLALASPGNPTGWTATAEDWHRIVRFCEQHGLWLLADGAYERIVYDGPVAPSPLAIPEARSRLLIAQTLSKAYRMTGWRIGYVVGPPGIATAMTHLHEYVNSNAPGFVQDAARVALSDGEPFVAESVARYRRHYQIVLDRLHSIAGLWLPKPTGAFYVFPRLEGLTDSMAFCQWLVREHRVGLAPGSAFGTGGEGHIRLCYAVDEATLRDALDRFERGWALYREM
jgi:aspartate aminotransferase